ncbi:hypothetical protein RUM44_011492 [Polyplax serrata]|uniref:Uncharacterized protein n=1 Tax=Polyplax serrata TaxID=468196 RepID=A0ABR1AQ64_POLSC
MFPDDLEFSRKMFGQKTTLNPVNPKILESAGHLNSGSLNLNQINRTLHSGRQKRDTQQEIAALEAQIKDLKYSLESARSGLSALEKFKEIQTKNLEKAKEKNDTNEINRYTDSLKQIEGNFPKARDEIQEKEAQLKALEQEIEKKKFPNGRPTEKSTTPDGQSGSTATNAPAGGSSQSPPKSAFIPDDSGVPSQMPSIWTLFMQKKTYFLSRLLDGIKYLVTTMGNKFRADIEFLRGMSEKKTLL